MRNPVLGQTYYTVVPVTDAAGYLVDADALPTGTVYVDGVASGTAVTVTDIGVGLYRVSFVMTAGEGFADGDAVSLLFFATIGGVTTGDRIDQFFISPADWPAPSIVTLTIRDSVTLLGIAGAQVHVLDSTGVYPCGRATTDGSGIATVYLADGSYKVRSTSAGYTFAIEDLVVVGDTADTYDGTAFTAHPNPILVILAGAVGTVSPQAPVDITYGDVVYFEGHLLERDGKTVVDLSLAVSVTFIMRGEGAAVAAVSAAATVTDALNGVAQYKLDTTLLPEAGPYLVEFDAVLSDGDETYPARHPLEVNVREQLG